MTMITGSISTYELYLKGSSHGQLQTADYKMLEITGNHITVISRLFQVRYSRVSVDRKTNTLTYRDGALEKKVDLRNIVEVKKVVKNFFCIDDSDYYWKELNPKSKPKSKVNLQNSQIRYDVDKAKEVRKVIENLFYTRDEIAFKNSKL